MEERKGMTENEGNYNTHLCGSMYDKKGRCEYFLYADKEGMMHEGKELKKFHLYCTSEGKCRSICGAASFTGNSPKWCPKRKELGI